jgi:hypothetical protein
MGSLESNAGMQNDRSITMRIKLNHLTPLLAAGAAAVAIAAAPMAAAATPVPAPTAAATCSSAGAGTECSSPGNVQINDSPPAIADNGFAGGFYPGPYPVPFAEGGR